MADKENRKNVFSFGDFLREKREEKGLSLEKLEEMTKIKKTILDNLENERFEKLPPKIYIRGIISKYCECVDLDTKEVVGTFDKYFYENRSDKFNVGKVTTIENATEKMKVKHFDVKKFLIFVIGVLVLAFVVWQASLMLLPPQIEMINPKEETSYTNAPVNVKG
ncbi:MAG: helix-turn-helix domain-containing protein, partial [Candidatus Pacebacteria bacterium]|nr:helix-turn-helix domain-containing protein [Candidatus Paceibacterota bacterium]